MDKAQAKANASALVDQIVNHPGATPPWLTLLVTILQAILAGLGGGGVNPKP